MRASIDHLGSLCQTIVRHGPALVRELSFDEDQRRMATPDLVLLQSAQPHDLNRLVADVVLDTWTRWPVEEVPVSVHCDRHLPPVRMLVGPLRELLACLLDLSLETPGHGNVTVTTGVSSRSAVVTVKRTNPGAAGPWRTLLVQRVGRVELLVGERMLRALGGHLRLRRCPDGLHAEMALPLDAPQPSRQRPALSAIGEVQRATTPRPGLWAGSLTG